MKNIQKPKIAVISLGCDKNRMDTEYVLASLRCDYEFVTDMATADIVIVNTCGFIESAKSEAIDTIEELVDLKSRTLKKVVVTGCFSQRYGADIFREEPLVDAVLGVQAYDKIGEVLQSILAGKRVLLTERSEYDFTKRILTTPSHYAYIRVADGCDNKCAYCAIPAIRGAYRSRTFEAIEDELSFLKDEYGDKIKELVVVAQDVTRYGKDLYNEYSLFKLLDTIDKHGFDWVRLMYCYPELVTDRLIDEISGRQSLCKYIDVPLQHIDDTVLAAMNRRNDGAYAKKLIERIRQRDQEIAIRSTFITGFPAETRQAYEDLKSFISQYALDNAGFFAYSKEEGTPAAKLKGIGEKEKQRRLQELQVLQGSVMRQKNAKKVDKVYKVLCDTIDSDSGLAICRTEHNAPEIDSVVLLDTRQSVDKMKEGMFYDVKIVATEGEFDLVGELTNNE